MSTYPRRLIVVGKITPTWVRLRAERDRELRVPKTSGWAGPRWPDPRKE